MNKDMRDIIDEAASVGIKNMEKQLGREISDIIEILMPFIRHSIRKSIEWYEEERQKLIGEKNALHCS